MKTAWTPTLTAFIATTILFAALPAQAHISTKGALQSRGGDEKHSPCDGKRGDGMVYTFAPGATVTIAVTEDVPHPSYFRIAFDNDGEDFVEPASIMPIDKARACPYNKDDQCGKSDYCGVGGAAKGAIVLWDNLDPHLSSAAKGGSWTVKLPDVECDNCTIQVLQIMEDTVHGAYCPQGSCAASGNSAEDIYHRCIDIKLVKGTADGPGTATAAGSNNGMDCSTSMPMAGSGAAGMMSMAAGSGAAGSTAAAGSGASGAAGSAGNAGVGQTPTTTSAAGTSAKTPTSPTAGTPSTSGSAGTSVGMASNSATASTAGASAVQPAAAPSSSGGCTVAGPGRNQGAVFMVLLSLAMLVIRRRRVVG